MIPGSRMSPSNPHPKVLVIDSDPAIHRLLGILLEGDHCRVFSAKTAEDGLSKAMSASPELILLELEMPDGAGFSVLRTLRECSQTPVMILSSSVAVGGKVRALDAGACDYVVKPFNGAELAARVRVQLRARKPAGVNIFIRGIAGQDRSTREIFVNGFKLELTAKEEAVLRILASQPGALVTSHQLLQEIWGNEGLAQLHELRVYITRLRRKLEACGASNLIESERNVGYSLSIGASRDSASPAMGS